ncbi:MAG: VWA domain-containing protein [Acidobacteria bacterium]|nr:VWA domain-containing protein [Acidobacteriota bacterium]
MRLRAVAAYTLLLTLALGLVFVSAPLAPARAQESGQDSSSKAKPAAEPPAAAGGPSTDVGPIAIPKKKEEPPPAQPPRRRAPDDLPDYSLRVDVPLVNLDVLVLTKDGQFVPGLKSEHFRIIEDGVPQKVTAFQQSEAPITAVLVVEFASTSYTFVYDALNASYHFANSLKPNDWVAVVSFDMRPSILVDFTQNKRAVFDALNSLRIPGFRETNVFDALYDTLDRVDGIEGRKYIILISRGIDTFSKLTLDRITKKVQNTRDVTIFTISTGEALRLIADSRGLIGPIGNLDFLQADNQMRHFATMTGGRWYKPRFEGELPGIFREIAAITRNQYSLAYKPTNTAQDGSYRKIKVELVAPDGSGPLKVLNEKKKEVKVQIIAREGYTARRTVE